MDERAIHDALLAERSRRHASDKLKDKAERRLIDFVRLMWGVVEPAHEFRSAWPLEAWCEHLEAVAAGQITRLLGNIPPGFTKSLTTNAFFPAWLWGPRRRPSERFLSASYAQHLPVRDNIRFRHIITSSLYRELWGDVFRPAPEQFSVVTVANDHRGWKLATSIGGVGTGERADFFLCLAEEARVLTDLGWYPIGDIVDRRWPVKIAGWDGTGVRWQNIEAHDRHPGRELIEIDFGCASLRCTGDHPVFVAGRGYVRADSVGAGESLVRAGGAHSLWALLRRGVQGADSRTGRASVPSLRHDADRACQAPERPSHRLRQGQSRTDQPSDLLPVLPREDARGTGGACGVETVTVRAVRKLSGRPEWVYNLRVAPFHNYFAEGVLVHNCDDPNNPLESESEAVMRTTNNWFREVVPDRLNDLEKSVIIVIQQRTAEDDVSGVILSEKLDYVHLMIPMEYEPRRHCVTVIGWQDPRRVDGELAWPERFSPEVVERLKREKGRHAWASQYGQSPEPRGGGIFKRDWWKLWPPDGEEFDERGEPLVPLAFPAMECIVASLDTAYTAKEENDWSAMTVWGAWRDTGARPLTAEEREAGIKPWKYGDMIGQPKLMLRGAWQKRLELHDLVEEVLKTCRKHKVDILLIEAKAAGHSVAQEIARLSLREEFGVKLVNPGAQDKTARSYAIQHLFEAGLVYAPDRAWADAVINQCAVFPHGKFDDLVDSVVMALRFLRDTGMALVLPEAEERALEDYGPPGDPEANKLYDV